MSTNDKNIIIPTRTLTVCVIGHVDHGKTTLVAALTQFIASKDGLSKSLTYEEVKTSDIERKREITICVATRQTLVRDLNGNVVEIVFQDCPGHQDYLNNMVAGSAYVDYVIVAVSASKGWEIQTATHVELVRGLYLSKPDEHRRIVFAVTQLDLVGYDPDVLDLIITDLKDRIRPYISSGVFTSCEIVAVAAGDITGVSKTDGSDKFVDSCFEDDRNSLNLSKVSNDKTYSEFYDDSSYEKDSVLQKPVLPLSKLKFVQAARLINKILEFPVPIRDIDKPFLMEVEKCAVVKGIGPVLVGSIQKGSVKPGDQVELSFLKKKIKSVLTVVSVEKFKSSVAIGKAGDNVGICARGPNLDDADKINQGAFLCAPGTLKQYRAFIGKCIVISPLGKAGVIRSGAEQCIVVGAGTYTCTLFFLDGLDASKQQRVRDLVLKGAKLNAADSDSGELQSIMKTSSFIGAKHEEGALYTVLVITYDEGVRLPFSVGSRVTGQESKINKTSFLIEEVFA